MTQKPTESSQTISGKLRRLVWMMLIPAIAVAAIAGYLVYRAERDTLIHAAMETARALSLVADRELAVRGAVLRALALSPALERGDLQAFREEAIKLAPSVENAIVFTDPSGQLLLNTRVPSGATLNRSIAFPTAPTAASQALQVSDLFKPPGGTAYSFAVRVPVHVRGELRGYLGLGSFASQMQKIFEQQPMPPGWLGVVLDSKGFVVARSLDPEKRVGAQASPHMRKAIIEAQRGVVTARTLDGVDVFTVFNRAPDSGWTVLIGLNQQDLQAAALRAFGIAMLTSCFFLVFTLWVARRASRSLVEPLERLQADAEQLGTGGLLHEAPSGVAEIDIVQRSLVRASEHRAQADQTLQDEVAKAVRSAEQASQSALRGQKLEALGQLTGGIAHDFNNILQAMTTGLHLARRLSPDPRAQRALDSCERASAKAAKLTQQLMTFGRQQVGREELVDFEATLTGLMDLIRGALSEAISTSLDLRAGTGTVKIDPVQFELAVLNLALNARDAMGGRGSLQLVAKPVALLDGAVPGLQAGSYVSLSVRDNGPGMPAEVSARAFEPFFTTKAVGKGTGLGLAQVYAFARNSGGLATIESAPGSGTTVTIWLPQSSLAPQLAASEARPAPASAFRGTVLLVEDERDVRQLVSDSLLSYGFAVLSAGTADEALEVIRERTDIDIVLSDVIMPGERSGIDLAKTLKVLRPGVPVLLASGYADGLDTTMDVEVISKPYEVEAVARRLGQMLGQQAPESL